jgi:hypothetical protein
VYGRCFIVQYAALPTNKGAGWKELPGNICDKKEKNFVVYLFKF